MEYFMFGYGMLLAFLMSIVIGGLFMWIAAKIAGLRRATFARAIMAAVGVSLVKFLAAGVFGILPLVGPVFGYVVGLFLGILVIKAAFECSTRQALLVWLFEILASITVTLLFSVLVGIFTSLWFL